MSDIVRNAPDRFTDIACDLLRSGHAISFSAPGRSMQPTIRNGETIHVRPVCPDEVRRGDILLYRWKRGVHAHRVVAIEGTGQRSLVFILRGDAGGEDERVPAEKVLGLVISLERDGKRIGLRGPAAFARRVFGRSASRIRRRIADRGRLVEVRLRAALDFVREWKYAD